MIKQTISANRGFLAICNCDYCGLEFKKRASVAKRLKHHFCDMECFHQWEKENHMNAGNKYDDKIIEKIRKSKIGRAGEKNANWKGGKRKNGDYVIIYAPSHPLAIGKYVFEHRLVMEKAINRYLDPQEVVHHINGIKDDNRIENLMLFANEAEHSRHHYPKIKLKGNKHIIAKEIKDKIGG